LPKREDGWMVLQKIKNHTPKLALLPVIVLSSSDCQQDISDAYKYGSTAYTIKPMSYQAWLTYFTNLRRHWLETVSLPVHL
jgi:CheY-like chemotaxis protein